MATPRPTAMIRGTDNRPLDRDEYAAHLREKMTAGSSSEKRVSEMTDDEIRGLAGASSRDARRPLLSEPEALAVAALLDELAGVYPDEDLGQLAREMAVRLYDRCGI